MDTSIFYDYAPIDSYNALFNFIIGARGNGKTYGAKKKVIKDAIYNGNEFVYLRRTEVELDDSAKKFFDDLDFAGYSFRYISGTFQYCEIDMDGNSETGWKNLGYGLYLSNMKRKKSVSYPKVKTFIFDEFLISEKGVGKYLQDEVTMFLEAYETIARLRDVKVYFLSNAMNTVNPYFMYFNLKVPRTANGIKRCGDDIVIEIIQSEEYKKIKKQTRFGKIIAGTDYEKYAIDNEFMDETEEWIQKKGQKAFYDFTIYIDNEPFGIYRDNHEQLIFVTENPNIKFPLSYQYKSTGKSTLIFKNRTRYTIINDFVTNFEMGNVRFETQRCKQIFWTMLRKIL